MISRRSSGSMRAESAVEPTRSENITVTCRRSAASCTLRAGFCDATAPSESLPIAASILRGERIGTGDIFRPVASWGAAWHKCAWFA